MSTTELLAISLTVLVVILATSLVVVLLSRRRGSQGSLDVSFSLERIREMGELVALSAFVKEVVAKKTEEKSYFNTTGKIILICEFDLEFRYDLRKAKISHQEGTVHIKLPEHYLKIVPKREHLFDEKKSSFLGVFGLDFSTELRNELSAVARETATQQAGILKEDLKEKVQASAISTLSALACGMGAKRVEVTFEGANTVVELPVVEQEKKAA